MKYFTHYWLKETWEKNRENTTPGDLLDHISGSQFRSRGIDTGDVGYVVNIFEGKLYLCGKMVVGKYCTVGEAAKITGLKETELYAAEEHVVASESTPMVWDRVVSKTIAERITFESKTHPKLAFNPDGGLNGQTLRPVRLLTPESAELFDRIIEEAPQALPKFHDKFKSVWETEDEPDPEDFSNDFESGVEGNKAKRFVTHYERNKKNRAEALRIHKLNCKGCDMNFEKVYGERGKDYIHVHHLVPVSKYEAARKIDVRAEMTVLCPNCHAMVHRKKSETLSIEELRKLLYDNRTRTT